MLGRSRLLTICALLSVLTASGCARESTSSETAAEKPRQGGVLRVAIGAEPDVLNPLITTSFYGGALLGVLHEGLVSMNVDQEFEPQVAESWEWSEDHLTLTMSLKKGVRWSDGAPFSAKDVVGSFELMSDPEISARASGYADITDVTAVDDHTVRYRFSRCSPDQLFNANFSLLPMHIVGDLDKAEVHEWSINRNPVTIGPFRIAEWSPGQKIAIERNPNYYGTPAHVDRIEFRITPEAAVRILQLETGEVDLVEQIPYKDIQRLREDVPEVKLYPLRGRYFGYLMFNLKNPMLESKLVRQAINHAVDRKTLTTNLAFGWADPAASPIPPVLREHHQALEAPSYDPQRARDLLTQAGWLDNDGDGVREKDGKPLRLEILTRTGDMLRENGVVLIESALRDVGIEASARKMEHMAGITQARSGEFDIYYGHWSSRMSADLRILFGTKKEKTAWGAVNYGSYSNERADELQRQALGECDPSKAAPLWHEVQEILYEDVPWAFLYYQSVVPGIRARVRNATPTVLSPFADIERWWLEEAS